MSGTDQGATPGVYQILDGSASTAEQKFRTNSISMTDAERQFGVVMAEVQEDDTPYSTVSGTEVTLETGKAYFCSINSSGTKFVLPIITSSNPDRTDKLHTILVQFETHNSAVVNFTTSGNTSIYIDLSGSGIAMNKHYTASCMYRQYWNSSLATPALEWKWVVTITEDNIGTHS